MVTNVTFIVLFSAILELVWAQVVGISCTLKTSGSSGVCKLLSECHQVRKDIIKHQRLPQVCGFRETQPIVCCPINKTGDISKQKCREYSSYAKSECGHNIVKRIVGGTQAGRKEFPHMATLGFETKPGEVKWLSGGSIISESYILTTASALRTRLEGTVQYVKIGVTNLNDDNHKQVLKVVEIIPHPDYKPPSKYNDIGLLKVEKPIEINTFARPACLHTERAIADKKGIATGWGRTSWGGPPSDDLLKVTLDFVDYDICNMTYTASGTTRHLRYGIIDDSQMCAGSKENGKDTCQGDIGGPLQIYHQSDDIKCMYDIVAITSFGIRCGTSPGVYTRVSNYVKWIEDIVWPHV